MTEAPHVSIIIPTYNRPEFLRRSLASALAQTGAEIEVIVVDDGSDPPASVEASSAILIRTENRRLVGARNAGLGQARGAYVLFLDDDDWLEPDAIVTLLDTIRISRADVALGCWRNVDLASGATSVCAPSVPFADGLATAVAGGWVVGSILMARSIAARFETTFGVWEMIGFLCESLADGASVARCEAIVVNVAQHCEPSRLSIKNDHFEPLATANAFGTVKARLAGRGLLNDERILALDGKLIGCLHALLRQRRPEARKVYAAIDWAKVPRHALYRPASFAWCARWGGLPGARGFTALNRVLGR